MRHRVRGRSLGRNASHRKAMFRNMAVSLITSVRTGGSGDYGAPKVAGRVITTTAKAKELRPFIEKLITMARKSRAMQQQADELKISAEKNSDEWREWRKSEGWQSWNQAQAPVLAMRRRAFSALRDNEAVDILFNELAERFESRDGGYTRIVKLAKPRLGDAGQQALIEFVGVHDRVATKSAAPVVVSDEEATTKEEPVADEVAPGGDEPGPKAEGEDEQTDEEKSE
ncbi:bL17 family ribosomal protein [Rubinisphaera margarita]|uniref:bL17 family ribosomal protein n=1 Tax=Rubinisphaera margarita TaxID=2909586 RepID=UPI001EE88697|nr:50S ribosomal protein L17 [Rubinisphaera margarita]MCG6154973.1 50S ribosomal protein L17 [Rubinisphaera margarita]